MALYTSKALCILLVSTTYAYIRSSVYNLLTVTINYSLKKESSVNCSGCLDVSEIIFFFLFKTLQKV